MTKENLKDYSPAAFFNLLQNQTEGVRVNKPNKSLPMVHCLIKTVIDGAESVYDLRVKTAVIVELLDDVRFEPMISEDNSDPVPANIQDGGLMTLLIEGSAWLFVEQPSDALVSWLEATANGKRTELPTDEPMTALATDASDEVAKPPAVFKHRGKDRGRESFEIGSRYVKDLQDGTLAASVHELIFAVLERKRGNAPAEEDKTLLGMEISNSKLGEFSGNMSRLANLLTRKCPQMTATQLAEQARNRDELRAWCKTTLDNEDGNIRHRGGMPAGVVEALAITMYHLGYRTRYKSPLRE